MNVRTAMLRISGAIQVLKEELEMNDNEESDTAIQAISDKEVDILTSNGVV